MKQARNLHSIEMALEVFWLQTNKHKETILWFILGRKLDCSFLVLLYFGALTSQTDSEHKAVQHKLVVNVSHHWMQKPIYIKLPVSCFLLRTQLVFLWIPPPEGGEN